MLSPDTRGAPGRPGRRPDAPIAALRSLIRHRDQLVASAAAHIQRMQKALVLMNLQLHHVITDVTGVTGLAILRDIVAGETDPAVLARHRDRQAAGRPPASTSRARRSTALGHADDGAVRATSPWRSAAARPHVRSTRV